jgi:WD40 repeat protein
LYEIQQQQQQINCKLIQTFPQEHPSSCEIASIIQLNPNTLISSSDSSSNPSDNVIVIWSKSKSKSLFRSSLEYEPVQRITQKETGGEGIERLVLIKQKNKEDEEEEEVFASCSNLDNLVLIWRRGKGGKGDKFQIKQKITNLKGVCRLLYISQTNELIFNSDSSYPSLLHIWSTSSSSSSSDFVERQKIETSDFIWSLCQLNENRNRIEFASGHLNGQIMIWSKQQQEINYSLCKTLQPFNTYVTDIIFINNNEFHHFLISCSYHENKIVIYKGEEEEEEEEEDLEHERVWRLIPMSNGQFASGGRNKCLNIWSSSSSSSSLCS